MPGLTRLTGSVALGLGTRMRSLEPARLYSHFPALIASCVLHTDQEKVNSRGIFKRHHLSTQATGVRRVGDYERLKDGGWQFHLIYCHCSRLVTDFRPLLPRSRTEFALFDMLKP